MAFWMIRSLVGYKHEFSRPDFRLNSVLDINAAFLEDNDIEGLILDIDQTIVGQGENTVSDEMVHHLMDIGSALGGKVCFLTNDPSANRNSIIKSQTGFTVVETGHRKPDTAAYGDALKLLGFSPSKKILAVGDRIWTDVLGGNRSGLCTVRVLPSTPSKDSTAVRLLRPIEEYSSSKSLREFSGAIVAVAFAVVFLSYYIMF